MAEIDKTYTDSYKDYKEFKDWADTQKLTFFDGFTVCIGDRVWNCEEKDFKNGEIPIMNTPTWLDIYLIQNCKVEFVLDRLKSVYNKESYNYFQGIDLTAKPPANFKQNRKITIKRGKKTKFPIHSKPYGGKIKWWLQSNGNFVYNEETKTWSSTNTYYPHSTNTAHIRSIKGVVRHLRKQYLPKGISFDLIGRYVGEDYIVLIK
jgi:hypothetical protein